MEELAGDDAYRPWEGINEAMTSTKAGQVSSFSSAFSHTQWGRQRLADRHLRWEEEGGEWSLEGQRGSRWESES